MTPNQYAANGDLSGSPGSTSSGLLQRGQTRDAEAWRSLVQLYSPLVYCWCRRFELRSEDAADILQEVFQAVYTGIAGFRRDRPGDSFRGWLWTITRNKIQDAFRARARQPSARGGTDAQQRLREIPQAEPPSESSASAPQPPRPGLLASLEPVRAEFEDRTWQALWRAVVNGEPADQIAADLGMTVNAVRAARCRVLHRLRKELDGLVE